MSVPPIVDIKVCELKKDGEQNYSKTHFQSYLCFTNFYHCRISRLNQDKVRLFISTVKLRQQVICDYSLMKNELDKKSKTNELMNFCCRKFVTASCDELDAEEE